MDIAAEKKTASRREDGEDENEEGQSSECIGHCMGLQ